MNDLDSMQEMYPFDPASQTFTILTRISGYDEFFNPIDPSPAPARDLAPELMDYLSQCSDEIINKYKLHILMQVRDDVRDEQRELECRQSMQTCYKHLIFVSKNEIRRKRGKALRYILVSLACLATYVFSEQWASLAFFLSVLREAVLIGGWLFMWESVTLNFIEMDVHNEEIRKYKRLINTKLSFRYANDQ